MIIVSGFLGAGKTSVILSLAHYLARGAGDADPKRTGPRVALVENEIGDVAYDESLLAQSGFYVKNMLSGCICCTLNADLITTLRDIAERIGPAYVVFEPTGLAFPGRIVASVREFVGALNSARIIAVLDVERFDALLKVSPQLVSAQLADADAILINKADMASADALRDIASMVKSINARAICFETVATDGIPDAVWEEIFQDA